MENKAKKEAQPETKRYVKGKIGSVLLSLCLIGAFTVIIFALF